MKGRGLVLVAGLSRAGKSLFAERFCRAVPGSAHLPLDKYFLEVPPGMRFLDWVQEPRAIDWKTLVQHLAVLRAGEPRYTPCLDWRGSGRRLSDGGTTASHPKSRWVPGGSDVYVIPGCLAFEMPLGAERAHRVFIDTPLAVIAARCAGRPVDAIDVDRVLREHLTPSYERFLAYRTAADTVISGEMDEGLELASACARIRASLGDTR